MLKIHAQKIGDYETVQCDDTHVPLLHSVFRRLLPLSVRLYQQHRIAREY
jgi:hypothetical protein